MKSIKFILSISLIGAFTFSSVQLTAMDNQAKSAQIDGLEQQIRTLTAEESDLRNKLITAKKVDRPMLQKRLNIVQNQLERKYKELADAKGYL